MCECNDVLKSTATVAVDSGLLLITPTTALTPDNEGKVKLLITNSVPQAGANLPVGVVLNGGNVFLFNRFGNLVYGSELYEGLVLKGYYGNNGYSGTGHYQLIKNPYRNKCCQCGE